MIVCPKCGKELNDTSKFCNNCGVELSSVSDNEKKKKSKQPFVIAIICTVLLVASVTVVSIFHFSNKKKVQTDNKSSVENVDNVDNIDSIDNFVNNYVDNYIVYLKDDELYIADLSLDDPAIQLTSGYIDETLEDDVREELENDYYFKTFSQTNIDSKSGNIVYSDKIIIDEDSVDYPPSAFNRSLYFRNIKETDVEPVKIASDVFSYKVNNDFTIITYKENSSNGLYQYNIETQTKEKISTGINYYYVSDDGQSLFFIDYDDRLYVKYNDADKEKVDSEVYDICHISEDFNTIYYIREGTLYKKTKDAEKIKIASDVNVVLRVYDDTGEIYYTKDYVSTTYMDYIDDDMFEIDANLFEPTAPQIPDEWDYDTDEEYENAYDDYLIEYEQYEHDYLLYENKLARDELRESLSWSNFVTSKLCYYDGSEEHIITDSYTSQPNCSVTEEKPVIMYHTYLLPETKSVKLSEISDYDDVDEKIDISSEWYMAVKNTATKIEQENPSRLILNDDGTIAYYINDNSEHSMTGDIYKVQITNNTISEPELYDSDVAGLELIDNDKIIYSKDYNFDTHNYDLYCDKKIIDYDVRSYDYNEKSKTLAYFTDWDGDRQYGTLKIYANDTVTKIADDTNSYYIMDSGKIAYLYDYSINYGKGELRYWENGNSEKIEYDVSSIADITNPNEKE